MLFNTTTRENQIVTKAEMGSRAWLLRAIEINISATKRMREEGRDHQARIHDGFADMYAARLRDINMEENSND